MQSLSTCDLWPTGRGVCWSPDLSLPLPQLQMCPIPYGMTQELLSLLPHYPHTQMCSQDLHQLIQSSPVGLASHDPWDSQIQCNQIFWLEQESERSMCLRPILVTHSFHYAMLCKQSIVTTELDLFILQACSQYHIVNMSF